MVFMVFVIRKSQLDKLRIDATASKATNVISFFDCFRRILAYTYRRDFPIRFDCWQVFDGQKYQPNKTSK